MLLRAGLENVQIPVLALLLAAAGVTKLAQLARRSAAGELLVPTAFFPVSARRPMGMAVCAVELCLSAGLLVTAGRDDLTAKGVRGAAGVLFVVAACALIELRANHPEAGCGCFGDFSTAPVSLRSIIRPALLAVGALASINGQFRAADFGLRPVAELVGLLLAELAVVAVLSPEVGEGLIRLGYTEPCELQSVPSRRTLAALHRSRQWRLHAPLLTAQAPADMWREMCWRYVVYPASHDGAPCDLVFAVFLAHHRSPVIRTAVVDASTGQPVPWPQQPPSRWRPRRSPAPALPAVADAPAEAAEHASLPVSSDV